MESILIDGVRYTIEHTTERIIVDGKECGGECDYDKCRIRISDATIGGGRVPVTLMHEIVHAMLFERGLYEEADNEGLVEAISKGIVYLFSHNNGLESYIKGC